MVGIRIKSLKTAKTFEGLTIDALLGHYTLHIFAAISTTPCHHGILPIKKEIRGMITPLYQEPKNLRWFLPVKKERRGMITPLYQEPKI